MSYHVFIGEDSFNYTSNCSQIWYRHIDEEEGLLRLHGKTGKEAAEILAQFFVNVDNEVVSDWEPDTVGEPKFRLRYDASNGWGSAIGVITFTGRVLAACLRQPRKKVTVSS